MDISKKCQHGEVVRENQKKAIVFYGWSHIFFSLPRQRKTSYHQNCLSHNKCIVHMIAKIWKTVIYELSYVSVAEIQVSKKSGYKSFFLL